MRTKIIVIGSGVGGLTSSALLAQAGYDVTVLEAQTYPGGCASTWAHKGFRFESGATLAGGFHESGPHKIVGEKLGITWPVRRHDPAWIVHLPGREIALTADGKGVLENFPRSEIFWQQQQAIADMTWPLAGEILPWPPSGPAELAQLAYTGMRHFPSDIKLLPYAFMTIYDWVHKLGLTDDAAFMRFLDAQLLISTQTTSRHANALWGATALDLTRQGVYHVKGGIGGIAQTLVDRLRELGGRIMYRQRVTRLEVSNGEVVGVWARRGRSTADETFFPANFVIANTTPWDVDAMLGENSPARLRRDIAKRKLGWGAFVLHLGVQESVIPENFYEHHQVLTEMEGPLGETRSIFISISPAWDDTRAPFGQRAVTVTTHTDTAQWWHEMGRSREDYYALKDVYTEKIIATLDKLMPGFAAAVTLTLPGTPVTYQYYTDRHHGMVGGFPMTSLFSARGPRTGIRNLRIVGDSIFPGQSTAGVTLGAMRVAVDVQRSIGLSTSHAVNHPVMLTSDGDAETERELV